MENYEKKYKEDLENFVDIQGYKGLYKVNNRGDILSVRSKKILKAGKRKKKKYEILPRKILGVVAVVGMMEISKNIYKGLSHE